MKRIDEREKPVEIYRSTTEKLFRVFHACATTTLNFFVCVDAAEHCDRVDLFCRRRSCVLPHHLALLLMFISRRFSSSRGRDERSTIHDGDETDEDFECVPEQQQQFSLSMFACNFHPLEIQSI